MTETRTIRKWFWVWDFEKEEDWLNEMAAAGWALYRTGICRYEFERTEPEVYTIRMCHGDRDMIGFMEDTGAEYIEGGVGGWMYFRKHISNGSFEMFSDLESRAEHLQGIERTLKCIGFANIAIGIGNSMNPAHIGWINLLAACLVFYGLGRISGKKQEIIRQRRMTE